MMRFPILGSEDLSVRFVAFYFLEVDGKMHGFGRGMRRGFGTGAVLSMANARWAVLPGCVGIKARSLSCGGGDSRDINP